MLSRRRAKIPVRLQPTSALCCPVPGTFGAWCAGLLEAGRAAGRLMKFRMVVGDRERHEVEVSYLPFLAFLRVKMDGRVIHWSWRLLPSSRRRGFEFRTPADELHFLVLEPLHPPSVQRLAREAFRLWMDGQPVATLDGS